MWLYKAVKQKVCILSNYISTVLLISVNNPDVYGSQSCGDLFFEALCNGINFVGVCLCLLQSKGVDEEDLRYKEELKSK